VEEASRIQATPEGRRFADSLASLFF
jgi:hypothetical protein